MDITIPPYNLKRFTASITCLGKIGKDLYLSFDPLDGLTLSSLNEAKSAYGKFHFDSGFFERCSAPPVVAGGARRAGSGGGGGGGGGGREGDSDEEFYDTRYVCRVPVRSVHSILRPRKGVCSLRIRSEGMDEKGNYFGLNQKKKRGGSSNGQRRSRSKSRHDGDEDEDEDGGVEDDQRRGSFSARDRSRSRKRRKQSKLKKKNNNADNDNDDDPQSISQNVDKMMLSFEFFIERPAPKNDDNNNNAAIANGGVFRVLHKVGVTDANGITLSASATQRRTRSEIVSPPKLWLRLLDPLRRTAEVALTIDDDLKVVTATSFHPGEIAQLGNREENAVLQAAAARNAVLKTETSTGVEEFDEYDFRINRGKRKEQRRRRRKEKNGSDDENEEESGNERSDEDDEHNFEKESERPPLDVNQKVILVFSIKEAKAMLQYCAQTSSSYDDEGVIVSFHWGGRPIVIETDGDYFSAELVLATLHHGMIASNITVGGGGGSGGRRVSPGGERD
ncbi:hypothetical protein ACHAXR_006872 [Thalassiosira sp. AJA248-18]